MDPPPLKIRRVEVGKKRPYYLVWPPDGRLPVELHSQKQAQEFLEKERLLGVVSLNNFEFKSSAGGDKETSTSKPTGKTASKVPWSDVFSDKEVEVLDASLQDGVEATTRGKFNLQNMLRSSPDIEIVFQC